jgi:hypothetical protein
LFCGDEGETDPHPDLSSQQGLGMGREGREDALVTEEVGGGRALVDMARFHDVGDRRAGVEPMWEEEAPQGEKRNAEVGTEKEQSGEM